MSNIASFPDKAEPTPEAENDPLFGVIRSTIASMVKPLSPSQKKVILSDVKEIVRPISAPRAGGVLGAIVEFVPRDRAWTVDEVKEVVERRGIAATPKAIYNALGYLNRKGHIKNIGYGRYAVDGVVLETTDELGVGPSRPTEHDVG